MTSSDSISASVVQSGASTAASSRPLSRCWASRAWLTEPTATRIVPTGTSSRASVQPGSDRYSSAAR